MHDSDPPGEGWTEVLPQTKVGPHRRHYFQLENVAGKAYTHVKVTIHPDGGLKRVRLVGKRADKPVRGIGVNETSGGNVINGAIEVPQGTVNKAPVSGSATTIPILPLTPEAFEPFGKVIQAYPDHNAAPRGTMVTTGNQGLAAKFHKLGLPNSSYTPEAGATEGLSVLTSSPLPGRGENGEWVVNMLERHPFTTQAFIPMGTPKSVGQHENGLEDPVNGYLVVVAKDGPNDRPDLKTLRAFAANAGQGIMYNTSVWRKYLIRRVPKKHRPNYPSRL